MPTSISSLRLLPSWTDAPITTDGVMSLPGPPDSGMSDPGPPDLGLSDPGPE